MKTTTSQLLVGCLLLAALCLPNVLHAQLFSDSFDADIANWSGNGNWSWDANGKADNVPGVAWDNRSRLRSESEGGAALYTGPGGTGQLISPVISSGGGQRLYVSFFQYLQSEGGVARLQVQDLGGNTLLTQNITQTVGPGRETSAGNFQIIDVSEILTNGPVDFRVVLDMPGAVTFWLVDDFSVTTDRPDWPTFPIYFGQNLTDFGIPFRVDSVGMPFVPFELVVDFAATATPAIRQSIRESLNVVNVESCVCDRIEVWQVEGGTFFDPVTGQPLGDPGPILERVLGAESEGGGDNGTGSGEVDNIEFNFYNFNELQDNPLVATEPLNATSLPFLQARPAEVVRVAILDTGFDLDHPGLRDYLYASNDSPADAGDTDGNCYPDDLIGWNFVNDNNNPTDDHGHGTHVGGIVAQEISKCDNCTVQLIPYKTHNNFGVGTLFYAACGTLQAAVNDDVDVINASWGFYGTGSGILQRAIDTAAVYGTVFVAAAGNDSLNMVADDQFPATYNRPNILSVGAIGGTDETNIAYADFSNYNPDFVDITALGVNISSTVPDDATGVKSGTSMAAPMVAAAAALRKCQVSESAAQTVAFLFTEGFKEVGLFGQFVDEGTILDIDDVCELAPPEPITDDVSACLCTPDQDNLVTVAVADAAGLYTVRVLSQEGEERSRVEDLDFSDNATSNVALPQGEAGVYLIVIQPQEQEGARVLRVVYTPE